MDYAAIKKAVQPLFSAVCRALPREHQRQQARETIRTVLNNRPLDADVRRFCFDYFMSQLGYGGGF